MRTKYRTLFIFGIVVCVIAACATTESQNSSPGSLFSKETATQSFETQRSPSHQTPTIESISILKPDDAYLFLREIISSNNDCKLPCKTKIFPGQTTVFESKSILSPLLPIANPDSYFDDNIGSIYITYSKDDLETQIDIAFVHLPNDTKGVISYLNLETKVLQKINEGSYKEIYNSSFYQELISGYTLQGIYSTFGLPKSIFTRLENNIGEETAPDYFYFWALYPEQGIYLRYQTSVVLTGDEIEICPKKSFVTAWFLPQKSYSDQMAILSAADTQWNNYNLNPSGFLSINEVFNISTNEFLEALVKTPERCFKTKLSNWASP